ncbi:hypothetical protein AB0B45_27880 [Nonomuraea sp. NPDC049152]|uniref:hypothetical protein n=1 Tax=Nonomuraea sp. NPDC049152 TaxID=3154350 RepID=UPI0034077395
MTNARKNRRSNRAIFPIHGVMEVSLWGRSVEVLGEEEAMDLPIYFVLGFALLVVGLLGLAVVAIVLTGIKNGQWPVQEHHPHRHIWDR